MLKISKKWLLTALLLAAPVFAAAPKLLSVVIDGVALDGKALWYDSQVYVPLESVSRALDGQYTYDSAKGVASVSFSRKSGPLEAKVSKGRPYLKTIAVRSFSTGDNLKVTARVVNSGDAPARDIEITCSFGSGYLGEITDSIASIAVLDPGQEKTVEFWLYEQRLPDNEGGRPYAQPMSVTGSYLARGNDYVFINGYWERITHSITFRFLNPDNTYRKP